MTEQKPRNRSFYLGPPSDPDDLRSALRDPSADPATAALDDAIERCKRGDFTARPQLFRWLNEHPSHPEARRAQYAALAVTRNEDLLDASNMDYLWSADFEVMFSFAYSGIEMMAKAAVPLLLMVLAEDDFPHEFHDGAFDGLCELLGDEGLSEDDDTEALAVVARERLASIDADYILRGEPAVPSWYGQRLTLIAQRSLNQGSPMTFGSVYAEPLSTWSGIECPNYDGQVLSAAQVESLVQYVLRLSNLAWRPGRKYFYGHDVEGGPGLHDAASVDDAEG